MTVLSSVRRHLPEKRITKLKSYGHYVECPACGRVIYNEHGKLTRVDEPAPCCGASGESRIMWPSLEAYKFLEIVGNQDLNSMNERRIAIVFLCTVLEFLLENSLWELLRAHTKSRKLAQLVLDSNRGRERRVRLYNKLGDRPLDGLFQQQGLGTFIEEWNQLADLRNDIVHGEYYSGIPSEADVIRNLHGNCLKAFAEVHNDVQRMVRANGAKVGTVGQANQEMCE